jgi:hypothetical protein
LTYRLAPNANIGPNQEKSILEQQLACVSGLISGVDFKSLSSVLIGFAVNSISTDCDAALVTATVAILDDVYWMGMVLNVVLMR